MSILNNLKYEIKYKNVKNINMRLNREGILNVSAPKNVSREKIEEVILLHYDRFYSAQQEIFNRKEKAVTIEEKEYIYLRGEKYIFEKVKDTKYSYSIKNDKIILYYTNLEKCYEKMIREIAFIVFNGLGKKVSEEMGLENIEISEKKFSGSFGKNYGRVNISLNYLLVHMDDIYIKHVLYHEYAHCLVFNHSREFYNILSKYDKNYRKNKKYIEKNLHNYC